MKTLFFSLMVFMISACSGSFFGPITKTKYKVDIGCTSDMDHYKKEREQVLKNEDSRHRDIDCPTDQTIDP